MRDRLIELIGQIQDCGEKETGFTTHWRSNERLADYLLENGVIVPAFGKGDIVYQLAHGYSEKEIVRCVYVQYLTNGYSFLPEDIGKTVFLTKEEAEKALAEVNNK